MKRTRVLKLLLAAGLAALLFVAVGCDERTISPVYCLEEESKPDEVEDPSVNLVFELVNQMREAAGLEVFGWSQRLARDAKIRAKEASVVFSHTRPDGSEWYEVDSKHMYGENLAYNYFNEFELMAAWMQNPAHFANLTSAFRNVGISVYYTETGECFWAMELGY